MRIDGLGASWPRHDAAQEEAAEYHARLSGLDAARGRVLRTLYRRSGVDRRGSVLLRRADGTLDDRQDFYRPVRDEGDRGPTTAARMAIYERHAPDLAARASRRALEHAGARPSEVTHVVTVSCTGFVSPGVDASLVQELGVPSGAERTAVGFMGCHGALNGLRVARALTEADPGAVVLVAAVELCSLHLAYGWDPDALVANALFADGAGAALCRGDAASPGGERGWAVCATGALLLPDSAEDMTWRVGDHGFRMTLSARVPDLIRARLGGWLRSWLGGHGLGIGDVASWAVHPGGPRILDAVEEAAGLPDGSLEVSRDVLREHGNMSSATILFILERLRARGARTPCVALGFGPGLVFEAILFG